MTSRAGVLPSPPMVRRCMRRCRQWPCPRSPFVAGRKLVTKQKVGPAQFRQRHLAAARTSNVFSTLCGWRHIFKTPETLFQSVRDSIQFTDWDPFERPEPACCRGKEDQREDRDEQAEQTLDASRVHEVGSGRRVSTPLYRQCGG